MIYSEDGALKPNKTNWEQEGVGANAIKLRKIRVQVLFLQEDKTCPLVFLIEYFASIYFIGDAFKPTWSENGGIQANQRGSWKWQKASHTH